MKISDIMEEDGFLEDELFFGVVMRTNYIKTKEILEYLSKLNGVDLIYQKKDFNYLFITNNDPFSGEGSGNRYVKAK